MNWRSLLVLLISIVTVIGFATAYTATLEGGGSGGGGGGGDGPTYSDDPDDPDDDDTPESDEDDIPDEDSITCWNQEDMDEDGLTDTDDPGCVRPGWNVTVEGMIWESHIVSVMEGFDPDSDAIYEEQSHTPDPETTEAFFFEGFVEQGNDIENEVNEDITDDGYIELNWVDAARNEDENYGFGFPKVTGYSITNFPGHNDQDPETSGNRVIDAPHDLSTVCGNGMEDLGISKIGDQAGDEDAETDCRGDYGRIQEINYRQQPLERSGLSCENDEASCESDSSCSCTSSSCSGSSCSDGSCSSSANVDCSVDEDNSDHEDHEYWQTTNDRVHQTSCEDDGGWIASDSEYTSCSTSGCSTTWTYSCGPNNTETCTGSCSADGDSSSSYDEDEAGRYRAWEDSTSRNCHQSYSVTDGGGITNNDRMDNDPAGTYTKFTAHEDPNWGTRTFSSTGESGDGSAWCGYDFTLTVNADGPQGNGNGFIVIDERSGSHSNDARRVVARESPDGTESVGRNVHYGYDGDADSVYDADFIDEVTLSCPGDKEVCLRYADFYTNSGGSSGNPAWTTVEDAVEARSEVFTADQSYSVCKAINRINDEHGDSRGDNLIDCDFMRDDSGDGEGDNISPLTQACGDEPDEHVMLMEGPQVNSDLVEDYLFHEQKCVDWGEDDPGLDVPNSLDSNACVNKGEAFAEGTVKNVISMDTEEGYEEGQDSPDWQVCLNIDHDNSDKPFNHRHNDWSNEGFGGQWYDLDDERVNSYLSSNEGRLGLSTDQRTGTEHYIDYYYTENPNPYHSTYNPKGGERGTALIADCGPLLSGCADEGDGTRDSINSQEGYFGFFTQGSRDEDYHPQGEDEFGVIPPVFMGQINEIRKYPENNQLGEDHYDYDVYSPGWYRNTYIDADNAVQYAYTDSLEWVVDSTGVPYPPWGASETGPYADDSGIHYRHDYTGSERNDVTDSTVQKTERAFGNSLAVVADQDISGTNIEEGDGFWIDPDNVRYHWEEGHIDANSWRDFISFSIDLTGADSGLGWDYTEDEYATGSYHPLDQDFEDGGKVVYTDIHWEQEGGTRADGLYPPMCGDDRYEFLLEEIGEAPHSERFTGTYGCATRQDLCFSSEENSFHETGTHFQTDEDGERENRLKQDLEYCDTNSRGLGTWYDQDFRQGDSSDEYCRENSLYGSDGKRWFSADYVQEHPHAVTGGIDDSWNDYMAQQDYERFESRPNAESWDFSTETPVDTGTNFDYTASLGFCGGDDGGEHLVTQECNTQLCSTNRNVIGVAQGQEYCIFDGSESQYSHAVDEEVEDRRLYEPGSEITFDLNEERTISCFGGTWYDSWPIVFSESDVEIPVGDEKVVEFRVINVENVERTFEVEMFENTDLYTFSSFVEESGSSFRTTVEPQSSERFRIRMTGGREGVEDELTLGAEAVNSDVYGEDSVRAKIVEDPEVEGVDVGEPESVPGIGLTQVMALVVSATLMFFFRS